MLKVLFMTIIGILLLNSITVVNNTIEVGLNQDQTPLIAFIQADILYFLFGLLIQWKKIGEILKRRSLKINHLFIPAICLVIIGLIPEPVWLEHFSSMMLLSPLYHIETNAVIGVLSGYLLIQSIEQK